MVQRSLAAAGPGSPALLLAERVGAVQLPAPARVRRAARGRTALGPGVVCVATGTGITPVLAAVRAGHVPAWLVWAAPSPRASFGDTLVDEVLAAACDTTVWDTTRFGEPDLLRLAYAAFVSAGAEAVICVCHRSRARRLVRALRARGVPAQAGAD